MNRFTTYLGGWNVRGSLARDTAQIFASSQNKTLAARADRMRSCVSFLKIYQDGHLWPAYARGDPLCPCCGGRRARVTQRYLAGLQSLLASTPDAKIVSGCFTVANVDLRHLRMEIAHIVTSFTSRFVRALAHRLGGALSYLRKVEVTAAADGRAHPHLHVMLVLPHGWAEDYSLKQMWQDAGKLKRGATVWFDELDVHPGESLREALESGFRGSDVFVALLDPEYPAKPALFFELGAAIGMGKRFVPIVPKGLDPSNFPLDVRLRRYLVRDSPEHTAEELSNALLPA